MSHFWPQKEPNSFGVSAYLAKKHDSDSDALKKFKALNSSQPISSI